MRDPSRIKRILALIEELWILDPDARFLQLMWNLNKQYSVDHDDAGLKKLIMRENDGVECDYNVVDLFNLLAVELFRSAGKRLGFKRPGATFPIFGKPFIDTGSVEPQGLDNPFGTVSLFDKFNSPDANFLSCLVI